MGTYFNGFMFMRLVFFLTWFLLLLSNSFSSLQPLCHEDESSALMQFKHRFVINKFVSSYPFAYPKVASWKNNSDCCSWDGVECSEDTGHVVSLDLSSSCLYGSINSNSSLFHLVHLRRLNLADNHFNYSQIPFRVAHLSRLEYLNLSLSKFSGTEQDLITGHLPAFNSSSPLKVLGLGGTSFSGELPASIGNLNSLHALDLRDCRFSGSIPNSLANLTQLIFLDLSRNSGNMLQGSLPVLPPSIQSLEVWDNAFTGKISPWVCNLTSLVELDLSYNRLSGTLHPCLGNFSRSLKVLSLKSNNFHGIIPKGWAKGGNLQQWNSMRTYDAKKLTYLLVGVNDNGWNDSFDYLVTITNKGKEQEYEKILDVLTVIDFSCNRFRGEIPKAVGNLTELHLFDFSNNGLTGHIPSSLGNLKNLEAMDLAQNKLVERYHRNWCS
ncbi:Receptor-like protein 12 [Morella rubra]|uniref:Receptor-like protein 12 n=1 Tax=Morella rubra TaxID=262757 RepID=A0A6A1VA13_9ROSI|nr:Receptor-like protein 12 [Morella rubra]